MVGLFVDIKHIARPQMFELFRTDNFINVYIVTGGNFQGGSFYRRISVTYRRFYP